MPGYIGGLSPAHCSHRGRARDFDLDTAVHVGLMAELVRLRFGASQASVLAARYHTRKRLLLAHDTLAPPLGYVNSPKIEQLRTEMRGVPVVHWFEDESQLGEIFAKMGGPPVTYTIINVERIAAVMRLAEEEWQARDGPAPKRRPRVHWVSAGQVEARFRELYGDRELTPDAFREVHAQLYAQLEAEHDAADGALHWRGIRCAF